MRRFINIVFILFSTIQLNAQTISIEDIEIDLRNSYQEISACALSGTDTLGDSLKHYTESFNKKLHNYTLNYPATITYNFNSLRKDYIHISTSEDSLFRIYSWYNWNGGTMRDYGNVFQYKNKEHIYSNYNPNISEYIDEYVPFYSQIFTLSTIDKKYYLGINNGIYTSKDVSQSIKVFAIENDRLNDTINLFKTDEGMVNSIDLEFDFFSVVDRQERPLQLIKYDAIKKIIYVPILKKYQQISNRFEAYQFNGQYFEKIQKGRGFKLKT